MCILRHGWKSSSEWFTPQTACWKTDHSYSQPLQIQVPGILPTHYFPSRVKIGSLLALAETLSNDEKLTFAEFFFLQVCLKISSIYHYILCFTHPPWKTEWCKGNNISCQARILALLCNKMHNPHFVAWMWSLKFWYLPVFWLVFIRKNPPLKTNKLNIDNLAKISSFWNTFPYPTLCTAVPHSSNINTISTICQSFLSSQSSTNF